MDVKSTQKKQKLVVMQKKDDPESCVVLRGQKSHLNTQLKRTHDEMNVIGTVETYKNPINLYNLFSEHAKKMKDDCFHVMNNKVTLKNGTTPAELLDFFNTLNDQNMRLLNMFNLFCKYGVCVLCFVLCVICDVSAWQCRYINYLMLQPSFSTMSMHSHILLVPCGTTKF